MGRRKLVAEPEKRASKGEVKLNVNKGWLRLRWNHQGKRYVMAVGLLDTPVNQALALGKAAIIRADILAGQEVTSVRKFHYLIGKKEADNKCRDNHVANANK